ncbi:unnamed protein product [Clonostachys rosea f. rosea IK726]|uniref:Uncharacterized protein n=1 Tax=Clonostachys rosea f. rosea IK726 TaxID=1349383 RepID=A0ACA9URV1_BIOOC|nr:unnamed protein product [Clonostachys rosea f. rosea IK726]
MRHRTIQCGGERPSCKQCKHHNLRCNYLGVKFLEPFTPKNVRDKKIQKRKWTQAPRTKETHKAQETQEMQKMQETQEMQKMQETQEMQEKREEPSLPCPPCMKGQLRYADFGDIPEHLLPPAVKENPVWFGYWTSLRAYRIHLNSLSPSQMSTLAAQFVSNLEENVGGGS